MTRTVTDFEDVKIGDIVFYSREVGYWSNRKWFSIPTKVTKVTKTQFTCENGSRYFKQGGSQVGGSSYMDKAFKEGEDETQKMQEFESHLSLIYKLKNAIFELQSKSNEMKTSNTDKSEMQNLLKYITKFKERLKNDNNN